MNKLFENIIRISFAFIIIAIAGCKSSRYSCEPDLYVLNVLSKSLYDECHIKGSRHVSFDKLEEFAKSLDKNAEIVIYCSDYMCSASGLGCKKLIDMGFTKVYAYEGGMAEWYQNGFPVEGSCTKSKPHSNSYLVKTNPKPLLDEKTSYPTISAQELRDKIEKAHCGCGC
ncbi:rhodanese-like domain-containing protein [Vermiphilus pyriformis]|nr:MAG: rhodanese-like domain-containing protein [Vermiphilus pyriformis]